jgi:hypothetical protein
LLSNTTGLEESIKLNQKLVYQKLFELENKIAGQITSVDVVCPDIFGGSELYRVEKREESGRYIVSVAEEIVRLLTTPIGSRVMRPIYGSELYKLRDRENDGYWRLMAIKYTFEAINGWIERVRCRKVQFELQGDGRVKMKLQLEQR